MYFNQGYLNNTRIPIKDKSKPLIVSSCGVYRLKTKEKLPTWRPKGRLDYQLLYVASGKAHFFFGKEEQIVTAGHMVLYLPRQEQHYEYYAKDKPEVYWVHFTGGQVKKILSHFEIPTTGNVFYSGAPSAYQELFKEMIRELQTCRVGFEELLEMYLRQLFLMIQRVRIEQKPTVNTFIQEEMEYALHYFREHWNESIVIEDYAQTRGMSVSWFLRNFKQTTNTSPMQFILTLRINNAVHLLESTNYNVTEIGAIVGYDNPLYFSRIFKKQIGVSPSDYRKLLKNK